MAPKKERKARPEFEVADAHKRLARPRQRKQLQRRPNEVAADSRVAAASHGEEPSVESDMPPPREDRAG
jgi:hypothetical protein